MKNPATKIIVDMYSEIKCYLEYIYSFGGNYSELGYSFKFLSCYKRTMMYFFKFSLVSLFEYGALLRII